MTLPRILYPPLCSPAPLWQASKRRIDSLNGLTVDGNCGGYLSKRRGGLCCSNIFPYDEHLVRPQPNAKGCLRGYINASRVEIPPFGLPEIPRSTTTPSYPKTTQMSCTDYGPSRPYIITSAPMRPSSEQSSSHGPDTVTAFWQMVGVSKLYQP